MHFRFWWRFFSGNGRTLLRLGEHQAFGLFFFFFPDFRVGHLSRSFSDGSAVAHPYIEHLKFHVRTLPQVGI